MNQFSEAELYLRVANELKDNQRDEGLWTKAFALENGNDAATKAHYIRLRVAQIIDAQNIRERIEAAYSATPTPETHVHCPDCRKLIPIEETACKFCGCKLIPQGATLIAGVQTANRTPTQAQHQESDSETRSAYYKAFIGERNQSYYLSRFSQFERASEVTSSWNWVAFFFSGAWALYRKMYGWFFAFCAVAIIENIIINAMEHSSRVASGGANITLFLAIITPQVLFGFFGNWLYFAKFKKAITQKGNALHGPSNTLGYLQAIGGVHVWVRWLGLITLAAAILGIVAAVVLPAYNDYQNRSKLQRPIGEAPASGQ